MEKIIDKNLGLVTSLIRQNKKLKLAEVTGEQFTISQLSKFETGKSDLTISKFLIVLKNLNVHFDEFQNIYDNFTQSEEYSFRKDLVTAYASRDIKKIKSILKFWELQSLKEPAIKYYKINEIVVKIILALAQNSKILEQDLMLIIDYLDEIQEWGRYEFWIFANCLKFFDDNALRYYGPRILSKANLLNSLYQNEQIFLRIVLNIIDTWLYKGDLGQALKYINYMKGTDIKIEFFYEKIILRYHEAHYNVLLGRKDSISSMIDCADTLDKFGFPEEAKVLFEEINSLE